MVEDDCFTPCESELEITAKTSMKEAKGEQVADRTKFKQKLPVVV